MNAPVPAARYRFGRFELQPAAQRLLADGEPVALGPRAFDVMVALVERAGELVPKGELLERVWPGLVVEENNLQVQVSAVRKALGPGVIATVPGRGYRFTLPVSPVEIGAPAARAGPGAAAGAAAPSVAVLPFVNVSDDAANEYFADGLSEELLSLLSKLSGLRVASRTSAFSFKGARVDIPTVARKLNVATILEGSVRKSGRRVRISAQLVLAATDSPLWARTYDRELEDIFAVQDDIARAVVGEIRATLMGEAAGAADGARLAAEVRAAGKGRSRNVEAYQLYLEGAFFLSRYTEEDLKKALRCFERAVAVDPHYALAWAALSAARLIEGANAWGPYADRAESARDAARRALAIEPDLAEGHWGLAAVLMYYDRDWKGAEAAARRALALAPTDSLLVVRAATLLQNLGRLDEARALLPTAIALDPLNVDAHLASAWLDTCSGRLEDAAAAYRRALELGPQRAKTRAHLCTLELLRGRPGDALREARREVHATFRLQGIALAQWARGRRAESDAALRELVREHADEAAYQVAEVHAMRGEAKLAFDWLERAFRQRDAGLAATKTDPLLAGLRGDRRWPPFLVKIGLGDAECSANANKPRSEQGNPPANLSSARPQA